MEERKGVHDGKYYRIAVESLLTFDSRVSEALISIFKSGPVLLLSYVNDFAFQKYS